MRNFNNFPSNKVHRAIQSISDPTLHLPGLLGLMAQDLRQGGIDSAIVLLPMIAFASLLTQAVADGRWPNELKVSAGCNGLLILPSSGGKSVVFRLLNGPVAAAVSGWIRGNGSQQVKPEFVAEDATLEGLKQQLLDWKSVGLFSDDAGICSKLLKEAPSALAKLLDGDEMLRARLRGERVELKDHRFCMLLMEQPGINGSGKQMLKGQNSKVGVLNRFLVAEAPVPPLGTNYHRAAFSPDVQRAYEQRVNLLVNLSIEQLISGADRPVIKLSDRAKAYFEDCGREVAEHYQSHPDAQTLTPYLARHSERVLRLALVLHLFECGPHGDLQQSTVEAADAIGWWSIDQYVRMTHEPPKPKQVDLDAGRLGDALHQLCRTTGQLIHELSLLRRQTFNLGMTKPRFDRALADLCGRGLMSISTQRRKDFVVVHQLPGLPFWYS